MKPVAGYSTLSQLVSFRRRPSDQHRQRALGQPLDLVEQRLGRSWFQRLSVVLGLLEATTSRGDLSSRSPLNDGARITPSEVHSRNSTSATRRGSTNTVPRGNRRAGAER